MSFATRLRWADAKARSYAELQAIFYDRANFDPWPSMQESYAACEELHLMVTDELSAIEGMQS